MQYETAQIFMSPVVIPSLQTNGARHTAVRRKWDKTTKKHEKSLYNPTKNPYKSTKD